MFILCTFLGACIFAKWVTANPLVQSIQPCGTYQQGLYQPYETVVIQLSYNPYPQLIQNPVYNQPSIMDQISEICWEKILSNPTLRSILDNIYDQNLNTQINFNPYDAGVNNNYMSVPLEYLKINETEQPKPNLLRNGFNNNEANLVKNSKERKERNNKRIKKVLDHNDNKDNVNVVKPRKVKKNLGINTFSIENIKCYTPAEVLEESSRPVNKNCRNTEVKKKGKKKNNKESNKTNSKRESKNESKTSTKSKKNKDKKTTKQHCKETNGDVSTKTPRRRKSKKKKGANDCECEKVVDVMKNKCKTEEKLFKSCNANIDDVFNLNQDCTDLENRRARNSKNDPVKDSRNMHRDLPDDISINYASYINDLFSNTQGPNPSLFYGNNMYPFDLNQIYQLPQFSNLDVSKQQGNKSKRRKKKHKKKNLTKKKKEDNNNDGKVSKNSNNSNAENASLKNNNNYDDISDKITSNNNLENVIVNNNNTNTENDSLNNTDGNDEVFNKISKSNVENVIKKPDILQNTKATTTETTTPIPTTSTTLTTEITTESTTTVKSSTEKYYIEDNSSFEEPLQVEIIQTLKTDKRTEKLISTESPEEVKIKEIDKKLISETVNIIEDEIEALENIEKIKEELFDEQQYFIDPYSFNKVSKLGFLDGIPSIFHDEIMDDYYPDFTADNHAYLVSGEIEHNIHDRYFYTTHKNADFDSSNTQDITRFHKNRDSTHNDKVIDINENRSKKSGHGLLNDKVIEFNDNRSELKDEYNDKDEINENKNKFEYEGLAFRTPGLDIPGFITRKINKDKQDSNEFFYHNDDNGFNFDNYADKSDHSFKAERYDNKEKDKDKKQGSVVETVYARSKVVKYGPGQNFEKSLKQNKTLDEDGFKKEGGKTIVIAKSVSPEDLWQYH